MNVRELNQEQLYELKDKVYFMGKNELYNEFKESWDDDIEIEYNKAQTPYDISNETIYKLFDGIDFVNDDFCCTCGG